MPTTQSKPRPDLVGATGQITRTIRIVDAAESVDGSVDVRISDSMGNVYWTMLDGDISLD